MTETSAHVLQRDATKLPNWLVLAMILIGLPVVVAHVVPLIPAASQFLAGDRQQWFAFWGIIVALEWTFLGLVLIALLLAKRPLRESGLAPPRPVTAIVLAVLLALAVGAAVLVPGMSESRLQDMPGGGMFFPPADPGSRLFWVFCCLTAAVCEEAMFRGVAIGELRRAGLPALVALFISAVPFVYMHGGLSQGAIAFGIRLVIAVLLSLLYLRLKSIWPVVGVHFLLDASSLAATEG